MQFFRYLLYPSQFYIVSDVTSIHPQEQLCTGGKVQYMCACGVSFGVELLRMDGRNIRNM